MFFNLAGLGGLIPGRSCGRRRILPRQQVVEKIVLVIEDPSLAGQKVPRPWPLHQDDEQREAL